MPGVLPVVSALVVALQLATTADASFERHYRRDTSSGRSSALLNSTTTQSDGLGSLIMNGLGATSSSDSSTSSSFAPVTAQNNTTSAASRTGTPAASSSILSSSTPFPTLNGNSSLNGNVTNGTFGTLPSSGSGASYATACLLEHQSWITYASPYYSDYSFIETSTVTLTNYTVSTRTSACNTYGYGEVTYMVGDPMPVATWTSESLSTVYTSTLTIDVKPPVCNVTAADCEALWRDYDANDAASNYSMPYPGWIDGCDDKPEWGKCGACRISAPEVELIYFPHKKNTTIDMCATGANKTICPFGPTTAPFTSANPYDAANCAYGTNTSHPTATAGPYTTSGEYTFFEGNAYLSFPVVSAASTGCNSKVGKAYSNVMLTINSQDLYSYRGYHYYFVDGGYPFNFDDMATVASAPWYQAMEAGNACEYYDKDYASLQWPNFVNGEQWAGKDGLCPIIYQSAYRPTLLLPPQLRSLDPAWSTCLLDLAGTWDPPIALTPAMALVPTTSAANGPATTKPPAVPASSPDSPDPTNTGGSNPDPTTNAGTGSQNDSPPQETGSGGDPVQTNNNPPATTNDPGLGGVISAIVSQATGGGQASAPSNDNNNDNNNNDNNDNNDNNNDNNNNDNNGGDPGLGGIISAIASQATAGTGGGQQTDPASPPAGTTAAGVDGSGSGSGGGQSNSADPNDSNGGAAAPPASSATIGGVVVVGDPASNTAGSNNGGSNNNNGGGGVVIINTSAGGSGGGSNGGSVTLAPGATTVLGDGTPVSVGSGFVVVAGGASTISLGGGGGGDPGQGQGQGQTGVTAAAAATAPLFTVGGATASFASGDPGAVVVGGVTVRPGEVVTIAGTPVSVGGGEGGATSGVVVVGGSTVALPTATGSGSSGNQEGDDDGVAVFTLGDGQTVTASSVADGVVVVGSQTLSAGSPVATLADGEVVSLAPGGDGVVVGGSSTVEVGGATTATGDDNSVATVTAGGQTFTATSADGTVFVGGTSLTEGQVATLPGGQVVSVDGDGDVVFGSSTVDFSAGATTGTSSGKTSASATRSTSAKASSSGDGITSVSLSASRTGEAAASSTGGAGAVKGSSLQVGAGAMVCWMLGIFFW